MVMLGADCSGGKVRDEDDDLFPIHAFGFPLNRTVRLIGSSCAIEGEPDWGR
jgi:hypothetical protein